MHHETPNTVHGRLLEAVHVSGYTFERAYSELEWLLTDDRWKNVGSGFTDINAFLGTIDFSEFKIAITQRKALAKRLAAIEASQRATARVLGVDASTINRDLVANATRVPQSLEETRTNSDLSVANATEPPAWFQADADPTRDAKHVTAKLAREHDRQTLVDQRPVRPMPAGVYRLIYADPPWQYEHVETENRAIENHYPTMTLDDICALTVPAADDSVLFLWATSPKLAEAMRVIESWQFDYRTCAIWDKGRIGMGYYFRQQHELLLVAARGALPVPEPSTRVSSIIRGDRGAHSAKPVAVIELLERMYPRFTARDRVELFCRTPREGWSVWGNEPAMVAS